MKLMTVEIARKLAKNGAATVAAQMAGKDEPDHKPVLKLFNPSGAATWLFTESDPEEPRRLFGLCDLGMGCPELGWAWLPEIEAVRAGSLRLKIERDMYFKADKTIGEYADEARKLGRIDA